MKISTPAQVVGLYNELVRTEGSAKQVMREIADLYDGDIVVPLPELQKDERPAVANIARQGIDQTAQRLASVFPEITALPSVQSKPELKAVRKRRRAMYAFHEQNKTDLKLRLAARYLVGLSAAPLRVKPNFSLGAPIFDTRSPLSMYAVPTGDPIADMTPPGAIFATRQTLGWLAQQFPTARAALGHKKDDKPDTVIDLLEYVDAHVMMVVASRRSTESKSAYYDFTEAAQTGEIHLAADFAPLSIVPNRTGMPLVFVPGQISMSQRKSVYHQTIGMYQRAAEMDALAYLATRQGILGEAWVVANPSEEPELIQAPDPFQGKPGIIKGASVQHRNAPPQFTERTAVGDLERSQRLTAGIPAELGGEAASNVRTGRRSDQLLSAVLDFPMAEAHRLFEDALGGATEAMAAIDLAYFGGTEKSVSVHFGGEKGDLTYKPADLWTNANGDKALKNRVSYFAAGMDSGDRIIALGQRLGMGTISQETVMRHDPLVDDVEAEISKVSAEGLERGFVEKVNALANNPESPLSTGDFAKFIKMVKDGESVVDAWEEIEEMLAQRQQEEAAAQQAQGPVPGPAEPGAGAGIPGAVSEVPEDLRNVSSFLTAARTPAAFRTPQG